MLRYFLKSFFCLIGYYKSNRRKEILSGYTTLVSSANHTLIEDIRNEISRHRNKKFSDKPARFIFFDYYSSSDLIIRQYIVKRIGEIGLHKSILRALGGGSKIHLLPPSMFSILSKRKIPISYWKSFICWYCYVILVWLYGVKFIFELSWKSNLENKFDHNFERYSYFVDLPSNAFPQKNTPFPRYDLVSWYNNWQGRNPEINLIRHSSGPVKLKIKNGIKMGYQEYPWPAISGFRSRFSLLIWGIYALILSFIDIMRGRWWHALLLYEAAKAKAIEITPVEKLATEYWFNHENYKYKPIWTYVSESRGVESFLYFYSMNNYPVQPSGYIPSISGGYWHLMNWKNCIVWGSQQEEILRQYTSHDANYIHVDQIPYTDSDVVLNFNSEFKVAVFDVPIRSQYHYCLMGQSYQYYIYKNCKIFFEHIIEAAGSTGASVIIKNKDRGERTLSRQYIKFLSDLNSCFSNISSVDSSVSPHRVIKEVDAVISMPFTSTALIARAFSKPACYYDPTGKLDKDSIHAYGIPVIQTQEGLGKWLQNISR